MVLENKIEERLREIRSLINHNDDYNDNANVEKNKTNSWFYEQDNSPARVFWYISLASTVRLRHETS